MDKKQQIVNLWRTCFGDSEAFISLYFDRVYKDENAMTIEKDGKIVFGYRDLGGLYLRGVHGSGRKGSGAYAATLARDIRGNGTA